MSITVKDVNKLLELSKLIIDDAKLDLVIKNTNQILSLVEQINSLNIDNIEPMFYSNEFAMQTLRQDAVQESNERDLLQSVASKERLESGLYLVPKVIKNNLNGS